jgi:hypothetical protein
MAKVTFLLDVSCSPDHCHTRLYKKGEEHVIGSLLMPQGLADALTTQFVPTKLAGLISSKEAETLPAVPCVQVDDKPLSAKWKEIVESGVDERGKSYKKTEHELMHDALFAHDRVPDW